MLKVKWSKHARADLLAILDYISDDDPSAAWRLQDEIYLRVQHLPQHPRLYRTGRECGTREIVVHPNYVLVYAEDPITITILRIMHAARQWPVIEPS